MDGFKKVVLTDAFKRDYKRLKPDLQAQADACIKDLFKTPIPAKRRAHRINETLPKVFSADLNANKTHKMSFQIDDDGTTCVLRRVGTHAQIDRDA